MTNLEGQSSIVVLQVQHDDAFVEDVPLHPYHTRFFDMVVLAPPKLDESVRVQKKHFVLSNFVSIMSYEDAIITALLELHDHYHIGSSISAIRKHMEENFVKENFPLLSKGNTDINLDNIRHSLFLLALKSLLKKRVIVPHASFTTNGSPGSSFILSREFLRRRLDQYKKHISLAEHMKNEMKRRHHLQILARETRKHVPARIKPPISKICLVDQMAEGLFIDNGDKKANQRYQMDLEKRVQKRSIFLLKLGANMKKLHYFSKRHNFLRMRRLKQAQSKVPILK